MGLFHFKVHLVAFSSIEAPNGEEIGFSASCKIDYFVCKMAKGVVRADNKI